MEVREGLAEGERIVTSAQFLIDSEASLQEAIRKMISSRGAAPGADDEAQAMEMPADAASDEAAESHEGHEEMESHEDMESQRGDERHGHRDGHGGAEAC